MKLDMKEATLLRILVLRGEQVWKDMDTPRRCAFDGLQVLGYAKRSGTNGTGQWATVTKRGLLKALADRLILHHPEDIMPVAEMLKIDRVRETINR